MWPFGKTKSAPPQNCDFELTRDELANFFQIANADAAKDGAKVAYKKEFVAGWERFAANPCAETATEWLNGAPDYEPLLVSYFAKCSPGGEFHAYRHRKPAITLKPDDRPIEEQAQRFGEQIDSVSTNLPLKNRASEAFKLVILSAVYHCFKGTEQYIKAHGEKDRLNREYLVNCEFFYFFLHLANRRFYTDHGETIGQRWQSELAPTCVTAFLESVIGHWPQEMKEQIHSELYGKLNDAERDYTPCRGLYPEGKKIFTGNTLFATVARNVAELAGTTNPIEQFAIMDHAFHVFLCLNFQERVNATASELNVRIKAA
jgi:hypothetical protein